jgi:hypothetical protein
MTPSATGPAQANRDGAGFRKGATSVGKDIFLAPTTKIKRDTGG